MNRRSIIFIVILAKLHTETFSQGITVETVKQLYTVKAKLIDRSTGRPSGGKTAYVTVPGPVFELRTAISDDSGNIIFLLENLDQPKQLIFQVNNSADTNLVFELADPFAEQFNSEKYPARIHEVGDTLPFYGKADKEYLLDDYVRFPTMEEVLREFVTEVRVQKARNSFTISVMNQPFQNTFFDTEPLILVDGLPVFDTKKIMELDPVGIRAIHVVARKYYFGSTVFSGIVSLSSYDGNLAGYRLPQQAVVRDFNPDTSIK